MQANLKETMESIRINPRHYFQEHKSSFESLNDMDCDQLLMLMMSSIGYGEDTRPYFDAAFATYEKIDLDKKSDLNRVYYYNILALNERFNKNLDLSIQMYFESYTIALRIQENDLVARALLGVATCFYLKGNLKSATQVLQKTLKMSITIEDYSLLGDIFGNYASNMKDTGNIEGALEAYKTGKMHYEKLTNHRDYINYAILIGNMAKSYIQLNQFDDAEPYINELLQMTQDNDFFMIAQGAIELMADVYSNQGDYYNANLLNKKLLDLQTKQQHSLHSKTQSVDTHVVSNIATVEALRKENELLASENAILHSIVKKDSPETSEVFKSVAEGLRKGSFIPFFQEVWDPQKLKVTGYEVLVRWQQADGVIHSPAGFIHIIEESPLIIEMSEQLIRSGLKIFSQSLRNQFDGNSVSRSISFNISPFQLVNQDLVKLLEAVCIEFAVPKSLVVIEITERTFIDSNSVAISQLHALKKAGFKLALDDFGTGYSSLGTMVELPIDIVKIDRSLISELSKRGKGYQLFKGIILIIQSLGLVSLAEGIETQEQLDIIKELNCDRVQGYYLHRPSATFEAR